MLTVRRRLRSLQRSRHSLRRRREVREVRHRPSCRRSHRNQPSRRVVERSAHRQPLRLSGFIWPNTERLLRGNVYLIDEPTGRGHVILYSEDPLYRGIWRSTTRLFFNSILFAPALN